VVVFYVAIVLLLIGTNLRSGSGGVQRSGRRGLEEEPQLTKFEHKAHIVALTDGAAGQPQSRLLENAGGGRQCEAVGGGGGGGGGGLIGEFDFDEEAVEV